MILLQENPFQGPLEGMGPEIQDFFGPWNGNELRKCHLGPKSRDKFTLSPHHPSSIPCGKNWIYDVPPHPPPIQAFLQNNLEFNSDMKTKSAL
jgi:hypothetical protein